MWNKRILNFAFGVAALWLGSGCATTGVKPVGNVEVATLLPAAPISAETLDGAFDEPEEPATASVMDSPIPVWNPTKLVRVELDAYVDEKGQAHPRTWKWVVAEPGGFNPAALRNPERAYIPTENVVPTPSMPGMVYTPITSPGEGLNTVWTPDGQGLQSNLPATRTYDMSQVVILHLVEESQAAEARAITPEGYQPVFDPDLGWVAVPNVVLQPVGNIQPETARVKSNNGNVELPNRKEAGS